MEARIEYLENRVKQLADAEAGWKQALKSNEQIMALMVKKAGGIMTLTQEEIKQATENDLRMLLEWNPEKRYFELTTNEKRDGE